MKQIIFVNEPMTETVVGCRIDQRKNANGWKHFTYSPNERRSRGFISNFSRYKRIAGVNCIKRVLYTSTRVATRVKLSSLIY